MALESRPTAMRSLALHTARGVMPRGPFHFLPDFPKCPVLPCRCLNSHPAAPTAGRGTRSVPMATAGRARILPFVISGAALSDAVCALGDLAIFAGRTAAWAVYRRPARSTLLRSLYAIGA